MNLGSSDGITFIAAVNDRAVLNANLLASPALKEIHEPQILIQERYRSAASAYNQAMDRSANDLIVFLHQDLYLPAGWIDRVRTCIASLEREDPDWGVAGCWGTAQNGAGFGHVYSPGVGVIGGHFDGAQEVQTL